MQRVLFFILLSWLGPVVCFATLRADELAIITNKNVAASGEIAAFYARARGVPENRIISLDLPTEDDISFEQFERQVVPLVRQRLSQMQNVRCLVTTFGVPLRIKSHVPTVAETDESRAIQKSLAIVKPKLIETTQALETMAAEQNREFAPTNTKEDAESLSSRIESATRVAISTVAQTGDRMKIQVQAQRMKDFLLRIYGKAATLEASAKGQLTLQQNESRQTLQRVRAEVAELQAQRFDPESRKKLRELSDEWFGLLDQMRALSSQLDYLTAADTGAAFDSDLSMVLWPQYPRGVYLPNVLHWRIGSARTMPVLMVSRLDAPTDAIVRQRIEQGIEVEKNGLKGAIAIDAGGAKKLNPKMDNPGFWEYEKSLNDLSSLVKEKTKLQVFYDDKPELIPAGTATDVAMYCGWYEQRNYVASCKFVPGAVGYHLSSYALVRLHHPQETGWVHGLLKEGAAAAVGPVAEPYLHAFPPPDEFFPLLMTGKLTLAEVYWKTALANSWMMTLVGDPLYTPYKNAPALDVKDLPEKLRSLRAQLGGSATIAPGKPATMP